MKEIVDGFEENWKDFALGEENAMGGEVPELRKKYGSITSRGFILTRKNQFIMC